MSFKNTKQLKQFLTPVVYHCKKKGCGFSNINQKKFMEHVAEHEIVDELFMGKNKEKSATNPVLKSLLRRTLL